MTRQRAHLDRSGERDSGRGVFEKLQVPVSGWVTPCRRPGEVCGRGGIRRRWVVGPPGLRGSCRQKAD